MAYGSSALWRGIALGAISGLKATYGPALLAASRRSEGWQALTVAAAAEMVIDKLPTSLDRSSAMGSIPRAMAGFWVAKSSTEESGRSRYDAQALGVGLAGAAAAVAVARFAPAIRRRLNRGLGIPDVAIGVAEDVVAITAGAAVVGMPASDLYHAGETAFHEVRQGHIGPAARALRQRVLPI